MPDSTLTCLSCGQASSGRARLSLLGTRRFVCAGCSRDNEYPMSRGYRIAFWVGATFLGLAAVGMLVERRVIPLGLILLGGMIVGLVRDNKLRQNLAVNSGPDMNDMHSPPPAMPAAFSAQSPPAVNGIVLALLVVVMAAMAVWVWPTRYRYEHTTVSNQMLLVRIDRFSGATSLLVDAQWYPVQEYTPRQVTTEPTSSGASNPFSGLSAADTGLFSGLQPLQDAR